MKHLNKLYIINKETGQVLREIKPDDNIYYLFQSLKRIKLNPKIVIKT
jgi:hypothetical protein